MFLWLMLFSFQVIIAKVTPDLMGPRCVRSWKFSLQRGSEPCKASISCF